MKAIAPEAAPGPAEGGSQHRILPSVVGAIDGLPHTSGPADGRSREESSTLMAKEEKITLEGEVSEALRLIRLEQ